MSSLKRALGFIGRSMQVPDLSLQSQMQGLLGLLIGERAGVERVRGHLEGLAERFAESLSREAQSNAFDPYDYDAKLLLLCRLCLADHQVATPAITQFADGLASTLERLPMLPEQFEGEAGLLRLSGWSPPERWAQPDVREVADADLLLADAETIRAFCLRVASRSVLGSVPVRLPSGSAASRSLPVVLLQKLREYDLMLAASLARTIRYLAVPAREELEYVADFLVCQQQADGRFGYFARELAEAPTLHNADSELYLPVTVTLAWSLAETWVPNFCLPVAALAALGR